MGEILTERGGLSRNGRRVGRALLASFLVLEMAGACESGQGGQVSRISSTSTTAASPEPASPSPSPLEHPSPSVSPMTIQIHCEAERTSEWTNVPPSFDREVIAIRLGVNATAIARGMQVWADCTAGVWQEGLAKGEVVDLRGIPPGLTIDSRCLMFISPLPPSPDIAMRHVGGVCPELPDGIAASA